MAKYKPAGAKKPKTERSNRAAIPCLIIIIVGFLLVFGLFYAVMRSGR